MTIARRAATPPAPPGGPPAVRSRSTSSRTRGSEPGWRRQGVGPTGAAAPVATAFATGMNRGGVWVLEDQ